jgi:hypothetical protein
MRIRIIAGGIYDGEGQEVAVGTELTVTEEPQGWDGRYEVIGDTKGKAAVTNPAKPDPLDHDKDGKKGGSAPKAEA